MPESPVPSSSQGEKFIAIARALECDEDEEAFKRSLRKVATAPVERKAK